MRLYPRGGIGVLGDDEFQGSTLYVNDSAFVSYVYQTYDGASRTGGRWTDNGQPVDDATVQRIYDEWRASLVVASRLYVNDSAFVQWALRAYAGADIVNGAWYFNRNPVDDATVQRVYGEYQAALAAARAPEPDPIVASVPAGAVVDVLSVPAPVDGSMLYGADARFAAFVAARYPGAQFTRSGWRYNGEPVDDAAVQRVWSEYQAAIVTAAADASTSSASAATPGSPAVVTAGASDSLRWLTTPATWIAAALGLAIVLPHRDK